MVGAAAACTIVADPQFERVVRDVASSVPALRCVIWFSGPEALGSASYAWLATQDTIEDRSVGRADDTAEIYFMGGANGRPQGVGLLPLKLFGPGSAKQNSLGLRSDLVFFDATPLVHLSDCCF